jgi:aldehyde dehydrogenase family 7 protein A1
LSTRASTILSSLDIPTTGEIPGVYNGSWGGSGDILPSICPATGEELARVVSASPTELHGALEQSRTAYREFRSKFALINLGLYRRSIIDIPAPQRGELLRQIREALSAKARVLWQVESIG